MAKIQYSDNQIVSENGHTGRFILPSTVDPNDPSKLITRQDACYDDVRSDVGRTIRKFSSKRYDVSDNERKAYASTAPAYATAPRRSMVGYEGDRRQNGVALKASFNFNWQPDLYAGMPTPALLNPDPNAWHVLFQWNSEPGKDPSTGKQYRWKSPPFAIGVKNVKKNGVNREELTVDISTSTDPLENTSGNHQTLASVPLSRGAHTLAVQFVNGGGLNGSVNVTFDGVKIVDNYVGATGHAGHIRSYCAYGWYQHKWPSAPQEPDVNIWFENFQEGLA